MLTRPSEDLQAVTDACKTAVTDLELHRLNIDIAALQETRPLDSGSLKEEHYSIFWWGKGAKETWEHGIGFAVWISFLFGGPSSKWKWENSTVTAVIICRPYYYYMSLCPKLYSQTGVKDIFCELLDSTIHNIPKSEAFYILGDFNARVGQIVNLGQHV